MLSQVTPARKLALDVIRQVRQRKAYAKRLIETQVQTANLPESERAFAILLINGIVASEGTLDEIIEGALDKPTRIRPDVRDALRIATYELIFLDKDAHAAVHQGVELTRQVTPRASGLANKLLRRIAEKREAFPWGDSSVDDAALAREQAFPLWLTRRLIDDLGREAAQGFMVASNQVAPLYVAVNQLAGRKGASVEDASEESPTSRDTPSIDVSVETLIGMGAEVSKYTTDIMADSSDLIDVMPDMPGAKQLETTVFCLPTQALPALKTLIDEGGILICDASAQKVAALSTPRADTAFLEVGSGRGTKTVLLQRNAWLAHGVQPHLVALDLHPFKTQILLERIARYHLENVQPVSGDILEIDKLIFAYGLPQSYGGALIDAPCSGTGTLRRHPEIRWGLTAEAIDSMASAGLQMLRAVARHIEPGGFLVYSTCSVLREENEQVIEGFLATEEGSDFSMAEPCLRVDLAPGGPDAHFAARLIRLK